MDDTQNFTEGRIFVPLVQFALPVLAALFLQTMYGAVDLLVVGQFGGELAEVYVSAVSTGSQLMHTVTIVITGLAMGLTVFVGHKIGEGRRQEAGQIIGSGICLFGIIAAVLTVVMVLGASILAKALHAPAEAFHDTVIYIVICSIGAVFIVAYNLVGSIFRGIGDSKTPLMTVIIACALNIGGDLLSLLIIRHRELPFAFSVQDIRPNGQYIGQILKLGTPIALQDLLVSITFLVLTAIVNSLGLTASAGVGVADKLCGFLMLVASAYMQSMSAFVAQNIGAAKPERARKALLCGIASSLVAGSITFCLAFFYGTELAGIFAKEFAVIQAAAEYLKAYAIDCLLTSFLFCFIGYFNGCSCTTFVMIQGIIGAFCVRLPVSWWMSKRVPVSLFHIGLATPASTLVQIILCGIYFINMLRRQTANQHT